MDALISFLLRMPALIIGVTVHEFAHAMVADMLGDHTARFQGRLTLNPLAHIDLFWTLLFPALLILSGSPVVFGMAKPVPVNPMNYRGDRRRGDRYVSLAGAGANFLTALFCGALIRVLVTLGGNNIVVAVAVNFFAAVMLINIILGLFNLIPIPPLDGSHVLASLLPKEFLPAYYSFQRYGMIFLFMFIFFFGRYFWSIVSPVLNFFSHLAFGQ